MRASLIIVIGLLVGCASSAASNAPPPTSTAIPDYGNTVVPTLSVTLATLTPTHPPLPDRAIGKLNCGAEIHHIAYSPDGTLLAAAGQAGIFVCDMQTLTLKTTITTTRPVWAEVSWSLDGLHIASALMDGTVRVWDAKTGQEVTVLDRGIGYGWSVAWSPDLTQFAIAVSEHHAIEIRSVSNGNVQLMLQVAPTGGVVAWSPDGRWIANACTCDETYVWNAKTGEKVGQLDGSKAPYIAWSPDGQRLAGMFGSDKVQVYDVATGNTLAVIDDYSLPFEWSPDGKWLVGYGLDDTLIIWNTLTGEQSAVVGGLPQPGSRIIEWSPDGRNIITQSFEGSLILWDVSLLVSGG